MTESLSDLYCSGLESPTTLARPGAANCRAGAGDFKSDSDSDSDPDIGHAEPDGTFW